MERQYDAVIVGCGVAGCFTALHLPREMKILMITKSDLEESDSFLAQGGIYENSTNYPHLTGDALAIALKHQIRLQDVSYVQIHPTTLYSTKKERRFLISESVRGEGAHLYEKNGRRFANELMPRDMLSQAIRKQMEKDGTDFVWLSMLPIRDVDVRKRFPNIYRKCLEEGYDVTREWISVVPAQHYFMGGVRINLDGLTSMEGLYAAGETCCNGVHGANRLASNSLLESLVFAENAAFRMAQEYRSGSRKPGWKNMDCSLEKLEEVYGICLNDFENSEAYAEHAKKMIWKEIKRDQNEKKLKQEMRKEKAS